MRDSKPPSSSHMGSIHRSVHLKGHAVRNGKRIHIAIKRVGFGIWVWAAVQNVGTVLADPHGTHSLSDES